MNTKFVREILRFPAEKRTMRKKAHNKCKGPRMCKLNSHGRVYQLNYSIEVPRSHNYPTRGYKLQRLGCLHRTNRAVIVSIDERACCLECCQSDGPQACSEKRAIEPKTTIQRPMIAPSSGVISQVAAQLRCSCMKIENCGGSLPIKGIQLLPTLQKSVAYVSNML